MFARREHGSLSVNKLQPGLCSSSANCKANDTFGASLVSDLSQLKSIAIAQESYRNHSSALQERNHQNLGNSILEIQTVNECPSDASTDTKQVNWFRFLRLQINIQF